MKNKLNIFYVSSEVTPFTQPGELGDVAGALPKYLKGMGHEVRVMMPNYKTVNERKYVLRDVIRLQGLEVKVGDKVYEASAKSAFIPDSKVQIYFLDNKHFFDRRGIYFDQKSGKPFVDNAERYIFFCLGCLEILKLLHWQPDVIHCNDWSTAVIPTLLKTVYRDDRFFKGTKTLLSIHNPDNQGTFEVSSLQKVGFDDLFVPSRKKNSHVNFLQAGLENADFLNPVIEASPRESNGGSRLSNGITKVLETRKDRVVTIGRGVDDQVWNPETDNLIPFKYSRGDHLDKYKNKQELLARIGLEYSESTPVISMIVHFLDDKVNGLILGAADDLMQMDIQLIIFGIGDEPHYKKLLTLQEKYLKKLALMFKFDNSLAHLILAGSDMYLMPYSQEWAGLSQIYGLTYGTIPIVSKAGGTARSIDDFNVKASTGTGFVLDRISPSGLVRVVKRAVQTYQNKEQWATVMQNAMDINLSWKSPAQQYVKLYQRLMMRQPLR
ncbi:glycogen synthase [bacterium]|nr:glycogen synthase [bacterium]